MGVLTIDAVIIAVWLHSSSFHLLFFLTVNSENDFHEKICMDALWRPENKFSQH